MVDQDFILAPASVITDFSLDIVSVGLHSLHLVNMVDEYSGFDSWVYETAQKLTPEQRHLHSLVCSLSDGLQAEKNYPTFTAFLDDVAKLDAHTIRYDAICWMEKKDNYPGEAVMLQDQETFISFMRQTLNKKEKGHEFDEKFWREYHDWLQKPEEAKSLMLNHLRFMWDNFLAEEWSRNLSKLKESVEAHRQMDYSGLTFFEAIEAVAGRDLRGNDYYHEAADKIVRISFTPSPHIGPYVGLFPSKDETEWKLIFGARLPKGTKLSSPNLSRSELLIRLSALADDTRLQMIELLTQNDELCAQDFITLLDLSQSSASRHLRQLTASGYLIERRREVAKCYSLNRNRIDDTILALKQFMSAR